MSVNTCTSFLLQYNTFLTKARRLLMENQRIYFPIEARGIYIIISISIDRNYPCKSTIGAGNGKRDHQYFKSKQGSTDFIHIHEGFLFSFYPPSSDQLLCRKKHLVECSQSLFQALSLSFLEDKSNPFQLVINQFLILKGEQTSYFYEGIFKEPSPSLLERSQQANLIPPCMTERRRRHKYSS